MSNKQGGCKQSAAEVAENDKEDIARLRELLATRHKQQEQQLATMEQQLATSNQQREQLAKRNQQQEQHLATSNQQREQLATRNQQLATSNQQQEQHLAASNQQREQLAKRNQQLAARNQQLAARNQHVEDNSIYALLEKEMSRSNETFECQGNDTSHTMSNSHLLANTDSFEFILELVTVIEDMKCQTSMLMTKLESCQGIIKYQSEADISMYTSLALDDAIKMISLIKEIHLDSCHAQSIFSHQPDHVVVYDVMSNLPVIAVEVKKCAHGGILTQNTAGQVFDYAVSMQAFGHKASSVVLASVEETHVTWLHESLPVALAAGSGHVEAVSMSELLPSKKRSAQAVDHVDETLLPPNLINENTSPQAQTLIRPSGSQQLMFEADMERNI